MTHHQSFHRVILAFAVLPDDQKWRVRGKELPLTLLEYLGSVCECNTLWLASLLGRRSVSVFQFQSEFLCGETPGRETIAPRPRKSGDFLFPSSREAKSSPQAGSQQEETQLQQRLKGHLKEFCREVASTEIKARPPKSDEEISKDLSSTEALEMRSFRGSDLWLSHITASLDDIQILAPRWDEYIVEGGDVPAFEGLDIFLGTLASVDPMDVMEQDGRTSQGSQRQAGRSEQGEAEMPATIQNTQEKPRASATKARPTTIIYQYG